MSLCGSVFIGRTAQRETAINQATYFFANSRSGNLILQACSFSHVEFIVLPLVWQQNGTKSEPLQKRAHCLEWQNNLSSIINCEFASFSSLNNQSSKERERAEKYLVSCYGNLGNTFRHFLEIVECFVGTIRPPEVLACDSWTVNYQPELLARALPLCEMPET